MTGPHVQRYQRTPDFNDNFAGQDHETESLEWESLAHTLAEYYFVSNFVMNICRTVQSRNITYTVYRNNYWIVPESQNVYHDEDYDI